MIYRLIRKYVPIAGHIAVFWVYLKNYFRFVRYSGVKNKLSKDSLIGKIITDYHVIEKGLTMPEPRLGFGQERLETLIFNCEQYIKKYGLNDEQLLTGIGVVLQYKIFHENFEYQLDKNLVDKIDYLTNIDVNIKPTAQKEFTRNKYFAEQNSNFKSFSESRLSVRNYSKDDVPVSDIIEAIELAKAAPSSCNRQTSRAHIYTDRDEIQTILKLQGGNRGFGHLTNKLIVITSELSPWAGVSEFSGPYVDGGIFAMNLMYSLHFREIACCPLNCNFFPNKESKIRNICKIPASEVFVVMLTCGYTPKKFQVPASSRYSTKKLYTVH